ncbi:MAG: nuclear transport factor 2 family protein, partial [Shewanella sp.]
MRILCLLVCLIFVPALFPAHVHANSGEMPAEQQLAVKYMNALTEHDYQTLSKFYNRDSVFFDKTA